MDITFYNSTFTVTGTPTTGTLADGSPWIAGSYELAGTTPNNNSVWDESYPGDDGPSSGAWLTTVPDTLQGFCTREKYVYGMTPPFKHYDSSIDLSRTVNLPATIPAARTLLAATGQVFVNNVIPSCVNELVALTGFTSAPAANSFRMNLYSDVLHPEQYVESDINYGVLQNLPQLPSTLTREQIMEYCPLGLPWVEYDSSFEQSDKAGANNFATDPGGLAYPSPSIVYGAGTNGVADKWSKIALWLNYNQELGEESSNERKRDVVVYTIQCGLDIASFLLNGGIFYPNGGQKWGRLFPVLFAGLALNDDTLLGLCASNSPPYFNEKNTLFTVGAGDVGRITVNAETPGALYEEGDIGMVDWGIRHAFEPYQDDKRLNSNYRRSWDSSAGQVLAMHLMGALGELNFPEVGLYNIRYRAEVTALPTYVEEPWTAYFDLAVVPPPTINVIPGLSHRASYALDAAPTVTLTIIGIADAIYYDTDGGAPNTLYTGPFTWPHSSGTHVLNAHCRRSGDDDSAMTTTTITVNTAAPAAVIDLRARS